MILSDRPQNHGVLQMLDINLIRTETEKVKQALLKRLDSVDLQPILDLDRKRRDLIVEADSLKMRKNAVSASVKSKTKEEQQVLFAEMKEISAKVKTLDAEAAAVEAELGKTGAFRLVERNRLEFILAEKKLAYAGLAA